MATKDNQTLPSKEQGLFRQVVKYYETKQYKKALKAADQVLKKFPDHGETLSMKVQQPSYACLLNFASCGLPQKVESNSWPLHTATSAALGLFMQGLIISSQDTSKKEEAYDLARRGIKNNLKSHVTWHVFGCVLIITSVHTDC